MFSFLLFVPPQFDPLSRQLKFPNISPKRPPVLRLAGFLFLFKSCRPSSLGLCPKRTGRDPRALDRSTPPPVRRPPSAVRGSFGGVRCSGSRNNSPPFLVRGSRKIFKSFCLPVCLVRILNREKRQRILTISGQFSWKICQKSRFFAQVVRRLPDGHKGYVFDK